MTGRGGRGRGRNSGRGRGRATGRAGGGEDRTASTAIRDRRSRADRRAHSDRRGPDRRRRDRRCAQRRDRHERRRAPGRPRRRPGPPGRLPDGRLVRGDQTKVAFVRAVLATVDGGRSVPTVADVARATGVTERLVHYHFATRHDLVVAAALAQQHRYRRWLRAADASAPLDVRVGHVVRCRRVLSRALGTLHLELAAHAAGRGVGEPVMAAHRAALREQLADTFAPEVAAAASRGPALLDALEAVAGWPGWWPTRDQAVPRGADRLAAAALTGVVRSPGFTPPGGGPAR